MRIFKFFGSFLYQCPSLCLFLYFSSTSLLFAMVGEEQSNNRLCLYGNHELEPSVSHVHVGHSTQCIQLKHACKNVTEARLLTIFYIMGFRRSGAEKLSIFRLRYIYTIEATQITYPAHKNFIDTAFSEIRFNSEIVCNVIGSKHHRQVFFVRTRLLHR